MKKSELIDLLFDTFDKEKNTIKKNLMMYTDNIYLQVKDENMIITIKIDIQK